MSTLVAPRPAAPAPSARRLTASLPRTLAWCAIMGAAAYFVVRHAFPYLGLDPQAYRGRLDRVGWLYVHILAGMVALAAGPLQFWSALRRRHVRLHRGIGRAYVSAVAMGAVASVIMLTKRQSGWVSVAGLGGLTFAWVAASTLAVVAIKRGLVAQHREWMVRSYVLTFAFVVFRAMFDALNAAHFGTPRQVSDASSWFCWSVPLLVTELVIQGRKIFSARPGRLERAR